MLTFDEVNRVNGERCKRWHEDNVLWTGADWATALGGEAGEALNIVKKIRRHQCGLATQRDIPEVLLREALADELADVFLYLDLLASYYEINLPAAIVRKFNIVSARQGFPERLDEEEEACSER